MPVVKPIAEMTIEQLEQRARFHGSTAQMYRQKEQPAMARKFQDLSDQYSEELGRRTQ